MSDINTDLAIVILEGTLKVIGNERSWTTKTLARRRECMACIPTDPNATSFCTLGAVYQSAFLNGAKRRNAKAVIRLLCKEAGTTVPYLNDNRGRLEVITLVERTLERLRAA